MNDYADVRIFLGTTPTDMPYSFDRLMGRVQEVFEQDPLSGHCRQRKRREIDGDKLPQIRHEHDLSPEERTCSGCGRPMDRMGEDVTRELELQPAKLEAHIHVRPQYACRCCKHGVCAAPLPPRPIPGGIAGPGLVAAVLVSKFGDHLPRYRREDILARAGVYLARSTLCDGVKYAAELCTILVAKSVIGSSRGPTCVNFFCACTRMIHNGKKGCPIAGRQPIPKPFSAAGLTNPEPGPLAPETVALIVAPAPADPASGRRRPRTARTLTD